MHNYTYYSAIYKDTIWRNNKGVNKGHLQGERQYWKMKRNQVETARGEDGIFQNDYGTKHINQ